MTASKLSIESGTSTILIVGATGSIGKRVVDQSLAAGFKTKAS